MRYGIIGNCKTAALVHENGSIDWCCLPNFDSASAFARLLDPQGGSFEVSFAGASTSRQRYLPRTNILETEFDDGEHAFAIIDFMPRYSDGGRYRHPVEIHRLLKVRRGCPRIKVLFRPRLNYARGPTEITLQPPLVVATNDIESVYLYSSLSLSDILEERCIILEEDAYLLLTYHEKIEPPTLVQVQEVFEKTKAYWEGWANHCRLPAIAPEAVLRSALALKLMTFEESGAIIAAPTTSLPEALSEGRNWDYRHCWLRDASLMLYALKCIGHFEEAAAFIHFLLRIFESKQTRVQILYGVDGRTNLEEIILPHLAGYRGSGPVRIGNGAIHTQQHDIYGELLNTLYLYFVYYRFEAMTDEIWSLVKFLVQSTAKQWRTADAGIWELRSRTHHFTFSKVLCWVAVDRGIKIAEKMEKQDVAALWQPLALEIRNDILLHAWNDELQSFTQAYGSPALDVSVLQMERYGFLTAEDPRWISTVRRCRGELLRDGFGFRYNNRDDHGKPTSSFVLATLWIANALFSIGEVDEADQLFEQTLAHANHLGLLSEDVDVVSGELRGNFPQAFSHMEIINTAQILSQKRRGGR